MMVPLCSVTQQLAVLLVLACSSRLSSTQCHGNIELIRRAANLSRYSIEVNPTEIFSLTCTAPCGRLKWTVNAVPLDSSVGAVEVESETSRLCLNNGCLDRTVHFLQCSNAMEGQWLEYTLRLRATDDFVIQCQAILDLDNTLHPVYSKIAQVAVIKPEPAENLIVPTSSTAASCNTQPSQSIDSQAVPTSTPRISPQSLTPTVPPLEPADPDATSSVACLKEQQIQYILIGAVIGLLVITLIGVIGGLFCIGAYLRRSSRSIQDNDTIVALKH